jgi:hypothetical protein
VLADISFVCCLLLLLLVLVLLLLLLLLPDGVNRGTEQLDQ